MFDSQRIKKIISGDISSQAVYIIAEIGINHNGSLERALRLMKAAKAAGVDAVKFQKRSLQHIYSDKVLENSNNAEWNFEYLIPILKEFELSEDDYKIIRRECDQLGIDLIITPFDESSAEFCSQLGVSSFKISSADMTNIPLLKRCHSYGLPLIISTGMWSDEEIRKCVDIFKKEHFDFALLLAQSTYPAPYESLALGYLKKLQEYSRVVGYSGHERGHFIPVAAVAMGCKIIEKHITFDKQAKGPDHKASMLPDEWEAMVKNIRCLEKALSNDKTVNQAETLNKELFAKSAIALRFLPENHVLENKDIEFKSPGKGIFPHEINEFIGQKLNRQILPGEFISKNDFDKILNINEWKEFTFSKQWCVKCRFHDFPQYSVLNSPAIEFHCSQTDLKVNFEPEQVSESKLYVHAPEIFNRQLVNICSEDEEIVKSSIDIIQQAIDKTIRLAEFFPHHKPGMVVHLGGMFLNQEDFTSFDHLTDVAIKNFRRLEYNPEKIDILPENLPPRPWYLGGEWFQYGFMRAEDMIRFCNEFNIGITFDICHAALYCNEFGKKLTDYTRAVMPLVKHVHISDAAGNSGEGLQIGEGSLDFDALFAVMKDFQFSWTPEIWSGHLYRGKGTYNCFKILEKKYSGAL